MGITIAEMMRRFQSVDLRNEVPKIIERTAPVIEQMIQEQLNDGVDNSGSKLPQYKSLKYAQKKYKLNKKPGFGNPDLNLTGSHYKGLRVKVRKTEFDIDSADSKSDKLENQYGEGIHGLTDKNKQIYIDGVFFNGIKEYIEGKTGVKFR
jgi:hypothetical protein